MSTNKKEFSKFISLVIQTTPCNKPIRADWANELMPLLKTTSLFGKKANRENVKLICVYRKYGPKKQKLLALIEPNGKELIVGKTKLINCLYPVKSRRSKADVHRAEVLRIMRNIIKPQIANFRKQTKAQIKALALAGLAQSAKALNTCKLSGKSLNSCKTAVDHIIPFIQLADEWLESLNISYADIAIKGRGQYKYFADSMLTESWYGYHEQNAKLQMTCSRANSKAGKKGYKL